jgi:type IV pilus assembly protein PilN
MARINLLPWRAERRRQRQKEFMTMLGASARRGVRLLPHRRCSTTARSTARTTATSTCDADHAGRRADRGDQAARPEEAEAARAQGVIEKLQANRSQMVHLFDSLVRTIPDGVTLTSIQQDGDSSRCKGRSQSNARVSHLHAQPGRLGLDDQPGLSVIEARGRQQGPALRVRPDGQAANPNAPSTPTATACRTAGHADRAPQPM